MPSQNTAYTSGGKLGPGGVPIGAEAITQLSAAQDKRPAAAIEAEIVDSEAIEA